MAEDNKKLLQAAKKNLDALGDALGKKIGAAIEKQDAGNTTSTLAAVKESFTKPAGTLTTIPDEVYKKVAEALNANAKIKSIFTTYSANEGKCIKQVATQIGKLLSKIDDIKVPVKVSGNTVTYTVKFAGSHLGVSGSFINVIQGKKNSWLNWKDESTGKNAMAQYCLSLYNLGKSVTNARKIIIDALKEEGARLLGAIFNNGSDSIYKKIFGNAAFKKVAEEYKTSEIEQIVQSVKGKKISAALTQYEGLNNSYNHLVTEINSKNYSAANAKFLADSFTNTAKKIQKSLAALGVTVNLETLPSPALGLVYNAKSTAVTLPANCTNDFKTSDYKSSVKNIYADTFTKSVTINGNANDNIIYGGAGKDVLYGNGGNDKIFGNAGNDILVGGKGNDTLTGGAGKDTFFYANGDSKDVIADFTAKDKIYLSSGSINSVTLSGKDVTLKIGKGSIKLQNAKNKEITVVDAYNNVTKKYRNDKLVSQVSLNVPSDALNYNGHSYYIYSNVANTWNEAKAYCEARGGHLAVINNAKENSALFNYVRSKNYMEAYFGLSDASKEGTWTWATSEKVSYKNFASGEPNGGTYENYGMFYAWAYPDGEWNDGDFKVTQNFICEWDNSLDSIIVDSVIGYEVKSYDLLEDADNSNELLKGVTFAQAASKK